MSTLALVLVIPSAGAQVITLKSGQKVEALSVRREGEMVMGKVQVGAGSGEIGYHPSQIAKIEFPEPRGLKAAAELLTQGQPEKALTEINGVIVFYEKFKDVPGSWWAQAALTKVSILAALRRDADAEGLVSEIQKAVTDQETARAAQLRLAAGLVRKKDFEKALSLCDAAIKDSTNQSVLAEAWVTKGDALFGQKEPDAALLAYLHVPVFYADEKLQMPAALLGSSRAYARLDDKQRAIKSLNDLIAGFPKSTQAAAAQTELQKLQKE